MSCSLFIFRHKTVSFLPVKSLDLVTPWYFCCFVIVSAEAKRSENMLGSSSHTQSFSGISQPWPFSFLTVDKKNPSGAKVSAMTKGLWNAFRKSMWVKKGQKIKKDPWQSRNKGKCFLTSLTWSLSSFYWALVLETVWWFIFSHS